MQGCAQLNVPLVSTRKGGWEDPKSITGRRGEVTGIGQESCSATSSQRAAEGPGLPSATCHRPLPGNPVEEPWTVEGEVDRLWFPFWEDRPHSPHGNGEFSGRRTDAGQPTTTSGPTAPTAWLRYSQGRYVGEFKPCLHCLGSGGQNRHSGRAIRK